jgi:hypothetical protein
MNVAVSDFDGFGNAILGKLVREIAAGAGEVRVIRLASR